MPKKQPFTHICQQLATLSRPSREKVDLHIHTTHSDGSYSPAEVVSLAERSGLAAIAITDHDTLSGVEPAQEAANASELNVIAGVEISTEHWQQELHLLGYFVESDHEPLNRALEKIRQCRAERFLEMVDRLSLAGVQLEVVQYPQQWHIVSGSGETILKNPTGGTSLGRRQLAQILVEHSKANTIREVFERYLSDSGIANVPKLLLPVGEAIGLVRQASGVTSLAHPFGQFNRTELEELQSLGLDAVEVEHPTFRPVRSRQLRAWASDLGMAVSGGSDCHGPGPVKRAIGIRGISVAELNALQLSRGTR